jgi:hypothetical protein
LTEAQKDHLKKRGFISLSMSDRDRQYSMAALYLKVWQAELPVLVTTDSILHAWHRSYDHSLMQFEVNEALAAAREAITLGSAGGSRFHEAEAQLALARALLASEGTLPRAEIEFALERAEALVETTGGRVLSPRILELRGRLAAALGDAPASDRTLRQALDVYREIGATGHAERLARELAS